MRYKIGVKMPKILDPRMFVAFDAVEDAWADLRDEDRDLPPEPTITSWADGQHMFGSYHGRGRAIDVRTKAIGRGQIQDFVDNIKHRITLLGFDVVLEFLNGDNEHLHIELDDRADA